MEVSHGEKGAGGDYNDNQEDCVDKSVFVNAASLQERNKANAYMAPPVIMDF